MIFSESFFKQNYNVPLAGFQRITVTLVWMAISEHHNNNDIIILFFFRMWVKVEVASNKVEHWTEIENEWELYEY